MLRIVQPRRPGAHFEPPGGAMATGDAPRRRESAFTLVRRLASGSVSLAKLEAQRGRQEVTENVIQYRTGVVQLAIAFGLVLLAVIVLMILLIFIISELTGIRPWVISLILLLLLLVIAAIVGWFGLKKVQEAKFVPEETIEAVKEDVEWATRLLRRG
jgi:uncharacterized membrane protein YqjE